MNRNLSNKKKIVNDPVYGLINIPSDPIYSIIEHKFFQRLRRIKQLGLTDFVYPGAAHTRFQHTLGAIHLTNLATNSLIEKGIEITEKEKEAVKLAILLHDIGHGPFSHTLEHVIIEDYSHEDLSLLYMEELNKEFNGDLNLAIEIFTNKYHKKFLHQLVSSQLDADRLDYLRRDSYFTGVSEGVIGSDRIIKMLNVVNDELVVEAKGIYSIEKFLIARWLMYWQVYLHKTVVSAEQLLIKIFNRAKQMFVEDRDIYFSEEFEYFLNNKDYKTRELLNNFSRIDDIDVISLIKKWSNNSDSTLSDLSNRLLNRNLFKIEIQNTPFDETKIKELKTKTIKKLNIDPADIEYHVFTDSISKKAYSPLDEKIKILYKDGSLVDIADASDMLNTSILSKTVRKYFLCYPKEII